MPNPRSARPSARNRAYLKRYGTHICWLCGEPIDMTLPPNHKRAWSMDHVVPVSKAPPELWHDLGNLREAHHGCNSARGNEDKGPRAKGSRRW